MNIVSSSGKFVREFFATNLSAGMHFHHIGHTEDVVRAVIEIGSNCALDDKEMQILQVAAWFHDSGYCFEYEGHENSSIDIADGFLSSKKCSRSFIEKVQDCIWATRFPQAPETLLEQVICDADLYHFSKENYPEYAAALRAEWAIVLHKVFTDRDWDSINKDLLIEHRYHTGYGRNVLEERKQNNIVRLRAGGG